MALLPIRVIPDPVLRVVCAPVVDFGPALHSLAADMLDTMYDAPGRGLAAPQIGVTLRLFVMDVEWKTVTPAPMIFVNPVILSLSESTSVFEEGCLSIPDQICPVKRSSDLALRWQDLDRVWHQRDFGGFAARCIQHETDHLDGVLCTDHQAAPVEPVPVA